MVVNVSRFQNTKILQFVGSANLFVFLLPSDHMCSPYRISPKSQWYFLSIWQFYYIMLVFLCKLTIIWFIGRITTWFLTIFTHALAFSNLTREILWIRRTRRYPPQQNFSNLPTWKRTVKSVLRAGLSLRRWQTAKLTRIARKCWPICAANCPSPFRQWFCITFLFRDPCRPGARCIYPP